MQQQGYAVRRVAVNLSPSQLKDKHLVVHVQNVLKQSQLHPEHLELELTENILVSKDQMFACIAELKALGIRLSIDDFGTGYSSLVRLRKIPADQIKIDMSFIRGLPNDKECAEIVKIIISLANVLNKSVIAEGVESEQQVEFLESVGCKLFQGYFFCRALSLEDLKDWLQKNNFTTHDSVAKLKSD